MYYTDFRVFKTENITLELRIVDFYEGSFWLNELYTPSDDHIAGTTIQVPDMLQTRHGYKYFIGQYKPSELASDYSKQGRENPSKEAYESLQNELGHYITASDCAIECRVFVADVLMAENHFSCGFDYSVEYDDDTIEERAREILKDHGRDFIRDAIAETRETLKKFKQVA